MPDIDIDVPVRAFALGLVCGMRAMLGPALIRPRAARAALGNDNPLLRGAQQEGAILPLLSAGEIVGDKLPSSPDRTVLPSVVFRALSGGLVGATLFATEEEPVAIGAVAGLAGALAATYGMFYLRRAFKEKTGFPSAICGVIEDGIAVSVGLAALRGIKK